MSSELIDPEILRDFASETRENLARMETHLLAWERTKVSKDQFDDMFRSVHNLKGTCGFLGLRTLEDLAHQMESALSLVRDKLDHQNPRLAGLLLQGLDAIETILKQVEVSGEDTHDVTKLVEKLVRAHEPETAAQVTTPIPATAQSVSVPLAPSPATVAAPPAEKPEIEHPDWTLPEAKEEKPAEAAPGTASPTLLDKNAASPIAEPTSSGTGTLDANLTRGLVHQPDPSSIATRPDPQAESTYGNDFHYHDPELLETSDLRDDLAVTPSALEAAGATVRVPKSILDGVLEIVGELALNRNQILHTSRVHGNRMDIQNAIQLHRITNRLEEEVLKLRLQPLKTAFAPLTRLVRDTAIQCGKRVRLEIQGQETETDRVIIDAIRDPLQHLVRNSIDHGIESLQDRSSKGKALEGVVRITARYDGGRVVIEVEDDGAGLNLNRIKEKALSQGLATLDQIQSMTAAQIQQFIFRPGFSTAAKISMISGRGVGLDIVKRNLEKISASVEVSSTPGYGTRFKIVTNRALVTVSALVIEVYNIRFAVMHGDLVKVMCIEEKDLPQLVKFEGGRFMRTGEGLLALIELRQILSLPPRVFDEDESKDLMVILVSNGEQRFGLVVDEAHDSEEIIVKPLGSYLTRMDHYKGVAILQDGGLVLILNIAPMLRLVDFESLEGVINLDTKRQATITEFEKAANNIEEEVVLCRVLPRGLMAVRLEEVLRLEELDPKKIEAEGEAESTQYWGEVLRLIPVQRMLLPSTAKEELWRFREMVPIIVVEKDGTLFGLVVTEVMDIVKVKLKLVREDVRPGLFGTILVGGKIAELIDTQALIELFENRADNKIQSFPS